MGANGKGVVVTLVADREFFFFVFSLHIELLFCAAT